MLATAVRTCAPILGVKKVLFLDGGCTVTPICSVVSAISTKVSFFLTNGNDCSHVSLKSCLVFCCLVLPSFLPLVFQVCVAVVL